MKGAVQSNRLRIRPGREQLIGFVSVTVFCVAIALLLFGLGVTSPFSATLVISLSIGYGISGVSFLLVPILEKYMSNLALAILLTPLGLLLGLVVAGLISFGDATTYLSESEGALILGAFFSVLGYLLFESRSRLLAANAQLAEANLRQQEQERALVSSELKRLQAQIEPHFLFNTLSNIVGLVHTNPDSAEQTLINLTTLLRSSLDRTRTTETTLGDELRIIQAYLAIHQIRMQNRLTVTFQPDVTELPPQTLQWQLPPLILQPLVENAIQHGIDPLEEGGTITIGISVDDKLLRIEVADSGAGSLERVSEVAGTGVSNVVSRLSSLYGDSAGLKFLQNQPQGIRAVLSIPGAQK